MPNEPDHYEKRRLADYRDVFNSESGKRVLADLEERFLFQDSRLHVQAGNTTGITWIDGQRTLIAAIKRWASRPIADNMPTYSEPLTQGDPLHG